MTRVIFSLPEDLVERIDKSAASVGLSRSSYIRQAVTEYMSAQEKLPAIRSIMSGMAMATGSALSGETSPEKYQMTLDELERQMRAIVG